MDQFLERYNRPIFTQVVIDDLNRSISILKIESIINNFQKQKAPGPDGFTDIVSNIWNYTKHLKKKLCELYTVTFRR